MLFRETKLKGAYVVDLDKKEDERGFFARVWCKKEFEAKGLNTNFVQANLALTRRKGTLRGLHYQIQPHQEVKLIRCIKGKIFDVLVDLRPASPTFKEWFGIQLTPNNYQMLYIPENIAHGYLILEDDSEVFYQVSKYYSPAAERGIRWNDPALNINWPETSNLILSDKDKNWPDYLS